MIEMIEYSDDKWGQCLKINNALVELMVPLEFGPRVMRYAFTSGENCFAGFPEHKADPDKEKWHSYGGHRLWHGPEDIKRTYLPDNDPVKIEKSDSVVLIKQKMEAPTYLQKEMEVCLDPVNTHVRVTHRIRNHNLLDIRLAVWAVSVMATGGRAIIPLPPRGTHDGNLQAQTSLNLWPYTDLQDTRWQFGKKYISFMQDPAISDPQKIGISRSGGWLAYINENQAFLKKCAYYENQLYQDEGSAFEVYADHKCVELESLAPLITIVPGGWAEMVEDWYLIRSIDVNASETDLDQILAQAVS
jgi:hypothetical protein